MPAFSPLFSRTEVTYIEDLAVTLPDPAHALLAPIVRPGVARYAGRELVLLHVTASGSGFDLRAPAAGTVRRVDLPAVLNGTTQLLEIEPLPFQIAATLQKIPQGAPTFYIAYAGGPGAIADDDLLAAGDVIAHAGTDAYVGVLFQDGAALSPWAWIDLLGRAMAQASDAAGAAAWNDIADIYSTTQRRVRVLNHDGRAVGAGVAFGVSVNGQPATTIVTSASSELILGAGAIDLGWAGEPPTGDTALPVQALYAGTFAASNPPALSAPPAARLALPADFM